MAGYVVQLRRALYRLAEVGAFDTVGVETFDDVGVIKASVLQFEQDKLSIGGQGVVNNRSEALWRTLDIWTDAWQQYSSGDKDLEFCFVTNRTCKGCLVRLSVEDRDAQENAAIADELEKERAEGEGDLQKLINAVLDKGKEVLVPVLERIRPQLGSQEFDSKLIETTIEKLHLSPDFVDPQVVYESLFGWLAQTLIDLWMEKQPGMISRAAFDRQLGKITDKLNRARVTARAARFIDVTTQDLEDARKHRFLYHLADIRMLDDRIDEELLQYIRFNKEKLRLMVNGSVDPSEWTARGDRLIERWKYSSDKHKIEAAEKDPCDIGMLIFLSAAEQREPLDGNDMPEGYMTSGHYNRLADDDLVYWNPSFKASKGTS